MERCFSRADMRITRSTYICRGGERAGVLWIATADPTSAKLIADWGKRPDVRFIVTSKFDVIWELQRVAGAAFTRDAVGHLASFDPERSARMRGDAISKARDGGIALGLGASVVLLPVKTAIVLKPG